MSKKNVRDFTEGNIAAHLLAFSAPMLLGNIFQAMYSTVDSFWVGRYLGPEALAAVSVGFPIIFALTSLAIGLTIATTTLISQSFGARNYSEIAHISANTVTLLGLLGIVLGAVGFVFRGWLIDLIGTPDNIRAMAIAYLGVCCLGFPVVYIYNVGGAILRGLGDSRTPLTALIVATITNIIL
jgi:Na+-driven multidrug efflux pump